MDSERQAALDRFIVGRRAPGMPKEVNDDLEIIFEAARKVANPDYEAAAIQVRKIARPEDFPDVVTIDYLTRLIVNAALGITEDTGG